MDNEPKVDILERRKYKNKTFVLGRDRLSWKVGWERPDGKCDWVKYFANTFSDRFYKRHPSLICRSTDEIVREYFKNPELFEEDFGVLTLT